MTTTPLTKPQSLNSLFSSWVNLGRPDSFCLREQYLKADGHEILCSSTVKIDQSTLPLDLPAEYTGKTVYGVADKEGIRLVYLSHRNELCGTGYTVREYPYGFFWIGKHSQDKAAVAA